MCRRWVRNWPGKSAPSEPPWRAWVPVTQAQRVLLSAHLPGTGPILVYQVPDHAGTIAWLRQENVTVCELEIPHGAVRHVHHRDGPAAPGLPAHAARCGAPV